MYYIISESSFSVSPQHPILRITELGLSLLVNVIYYLEYVLSWFSTTFYNCYFRVSFFFLLALECNTLFQNVGSHGCPQLPILASSEKILRLIIECITLFQIILCHGSPQQPILGNSK